MATVTTTTGGPRKRPDPVLTRDDVNALFELMSLAVYGGPNQPDLTFSGEALASWFDAYRQHLLKLMDQWQDLSRALQSEDAVRRARALHERLRNMAGDGPPLDFQGRSLRHVQESPAHEVRSLILGKGMEI